MSRCRIVEAGRFVFTIVPRTPTLCPLSTPIGCAR